LPDELAATLNSIRGSCAALIPHHLSTRRIPIMTTILIIVVLFLLLGGGGYFGFRGRR
jgi:hypothetical protein